MSGVQALPLVQQLLLLRSLQAGFKDAENALRGIVDESMAPGDRRYGTGLVAQGKITKSKPGDPITVARVTDPKALGEWLVDHGHVEDVFPMPHPHVLKDVEAASLRAGEPCHPSGELDIPGVEVTTVTPAPELKVYADRSAAAQVTEHWQALVAGMPPELLAGEAT